MAISRCFANISCRARVDREIDAELLWAASGLANWGVQSHSGSLSRRDASNHRTPGEPGGTVGPSVPQPDTMGVRCDIRAVRCFLL